MYVVTYWGQSDYELNTMQNTRKLQTIVFKAISHNQTYKNIIHDSKSDTLTKNKHTGIQFFFLSENMTFT